MGDRDGSVLLDFLDQYMDDREAGRVQPLDHYLHRFPDHREDVAREYGRLQSRSDAPLEGSLGLGMGLGKVVQIGPYRLVRRLGRGGQATVFLAEDTRIERRVALKVLTSPFTTVAEGRMRRFRREVEVIAKLDHPGICTVYDADLEGDLPYFALRHIEGETLASRIAAAREEALEIGAGNGRGGAPRPTPACGPRTPQDLRGTLQVFEQIARALQTAHEAGIVHRDIKPGNLMITESGLPVILDFGMARDEESDAAALTQSGELFGTPAYMSPEQVEGKSRLDPRTDVYSLGVVLYECLTLHRPFEAGTRPALYKAIVSDVAAPARSHNSDLPVDVDIVLETALERDRSRRYRSALELAEDLRRLRRMEPIHARPPGPGLRLRRWTQRHPVLAVSTFGTLLLLITGLLVSLTALGQVNAVNQQLSAVNLGAKSLLLASEDPTLALLLAIESGERSEGFYGNMALLTALTGCREKLTLSGHELRLTDIDVDPGARRVLTASMDRTALVWDIESGAIVRRLEGHTEPLTSAAFSPDGTRAVTTSIDGTARLVLLDGDDAGLLLAGHEDWVRAAAFDPRGEHLATASNDGTCRIWSVATGEQLMALEDHRGAVTSVEFSRDGKRILTASGNPAFRQDPSDRLSDDTARVWDASTGRELFTLEGHSGSVHDARFSPDDRFVATASEDGSARIWDASDGALLHVLERAGKMLSVAWGPAGQRLIVTHDRGAALWGIDGREGLELKGHMERAVRSAMFSPDGSRVVTGSADLTARIWDAETGAELATLARTSSHISECIWTGDGKLVVTGTEGNNAHVWYAEPPPGITVLDGHAGPLNWVEFDAGSERAVTASDDGTARVWSRTGELEQELVGHGGGVRTARFSPGGERVVTASVDRTARVWNAATGEELATLEGHYERLRDAMFDPTGECVLTVSVDYSARLWDATTGELKHVLGEHRAGISSWAFSNDGKWVATGGGDDSIRVWNVEDGRTTWLLETGGVGTGEGTSVFGLAFDADGRRLAATCENGTIQVWGLEDGARQALLEYATPGLISFSPDGERLLVAHRWGGAAFLTDARLTGEPVFMGEDSLQAHDMKVTAARLSPLGDIVMTASRDGTASLWDPETGAPLSHLDAHTEDVVSACFSPDGRWVATASRDHTARIWPVHPLEIAVTRKPRELTKKERERFRLQGTIAGDVR